MEKQTAGIVYLVGAGPGDPDLLTLRAARLLEQAKLVVHDGLVDPQVLELAPRDATLISVAKSRANHTMPQEEINALLVREALAGREADLRGDELRLDDIVERQVRVRLGQHPDLHPELGLGVDRTAHHRAGAARLFVQFLVDLYDAHAGFLQ